MSDEYLWNRSGRPDPDVERLERILAPLAHSGRRRQLPPPVAPRRHRARWALVLAASVLIALAGVWTYERPRSGWEVARLDGAPRVDGAPVDGGGLLGLGSWLVTDGASRARIAVGDIGEVIVAPDSRVGLRSVDESDHRLELSRGAIEATIWAPPGRFFVETPSALAVDLGCAYTLRVSETGEGELRVTSGWVAFERDGRESFVPAGARCATRPGIGPGTPAYVDASEALHEALERIDIGAAAHERVAALETILREARVRDGLTLWHLLRRVEADERGLVFDRLAALVPPPAGVTRAGIRRGDRAMYDLWWNALGLEDVSWWRMWKHRLE